MKPVRRDEILDYVTWSERRAEALPAILAIKRPRRVQVGELTFLFENHETVRYQIQEMVRVEQIVREADIQHEIDTYNELLGGPGGLGCALLIEIDDPAERARRLAELRGLPARLYLRFADGSRVFARFDARQIGEERLSSVQYLQFDAGGRVPVAIGADHPALTAERELDPEQRAALAADLQAD
jgi:hypothetical protein